jgi:hypothetical protein
MLSPAQGLAKHSASSRLFRVISAVSAVSAVSADLDRLGWLSGHQNPGKHARCSAILTNLNRLRWLSEHQISGKRARRSALGGCPGTKSRQSVPAEPPQVVVRTRKPGKVCPQIRLRWLSGHQIPGKHARWSASGGCPDTESRGSVPVTPPSQQTRPSRQTSTASGGCPGTITRQSVSAEPPQVVIRTPNLGEACPQLRLSTSDGDPSTET